MSVGLWDEQSAQENGPSLLNVFLVISWKLEQNYHGVFLVSLVSTVWDPLVQLSKAASNDHVQSIFFFPSSEVCSRLEIFRVGL